MKVATFKKKISEGKKVKFKLNKGPDFIIVNQPNSNLFRTVWFMYIEYWEPDEIHPYYTIGCQGNSKKEVVDNALKIMVEHSLLQK